MELISGKIGKEHLLCMETATTGYLAKYKRQIVHLVVLLIKKSKYSKNNLFMCDILVEKYLASVTFKRKKSALMNETNRQTLATPNLIKIVELCKG